MSKKISIAVLRRTTPLPELPPSNNYRTAPPTSISTLDNLDNLFLGGNPY